ncbi:MAG: hypothetical protein EA393_01340 [Bacteroidetes bacterium]|nr:MAG: hypothetical protein EA393_01340 [Bacteroidota bacterium]
MHLPGLFILLFGISGGEIFIILLLILLFFGPKKIPEIARAMGKGINEIKKVQRDINAEINRYSDELETPVKQVKEDIEGFREGLNKAADINDIESSEKDDKFKQQEQSASDEELPYPYNQASSDDEIDNEVNEEDDKNNN